MGFVPDLHYTGRHSGVVVDDYVGRDEVAEPCAVRSVDLALHHPCTLSLAGLEYLQVADGSLEPVC